MNDFKGYRILLADDEEIAREIATSFCATHQTPGLHICRMLARAMGGEPRIAPAPFVRRVTPL